MGCSGQAPSISIQTERISDTLSVVTLEKPSFNEYFITTAALQGLTPDEATSQIADFLSANNATIVSQDVFASVSTEQALREAMLNNLGPITWPLTWTDSGKQALAGIHAWAVSNDHIERVSLNDQTTAIIFEDACARYCRIAGVNASNLSHDRNTQAHEVFRLLEQTLRYADFSLSDMVRTWFYLDDILAWYGDFNAIRDNFFREKGVFDGLVPASTGIGTGNPAGSAVVGGLIAVQPKNGSVESYPVVSPLQCSALDYGSSFSRAAELKMPCLRRLYISGTASIAPEGHTLHIDDTDAQIEKTMQVVQAILESRHMSWSDVVRGIAYVRDAEDLPRYERYCRARDLPDMPVVVTNSTVCRDDLLFEIEVDTISAK